MAGVSVALLALLFDGVVIPEEQVLTSEQDDDAMVKFRGRRWKTKSDPWWNGLIIQPYLCDNTRT